VLTTLSNLLHTNPHNVNLQSRLDTLCLYVRDPSCPKHPGLKPYEMIFVSAAKFAKDRLPVDDLGVNAHAFAQLLLNKHKAYGPEPLRRWGPLGICIRIDSKVARYHNLQQHGDRQVKTEGTQDTLIDIMGYAVLGAALIEEIQKQEPHR
jgi:hypothetical protein